MTIVSSKHPPDRLSSFFSTLKTPYPPLNQIFNYDITHSSSLMYITKYSENTTIEGVVIVKPITINKRQFLKILTIATHDLLTTNQLLEYLYGVATETSSRGIFSPSIHTSKTHIIKALSQQKYKINHHIFIIDRYSLDHQLKPKSDITSVKFTAKNRSEYQRLFMKFLIEYDNQNNNHYQSAKAHVTRVSYFITSLLESHYWYPYLFFKDETPIGFIKANIPKTSNIVFPEIYIKPNVFDTAIKPALKIFTTKLPIRSTHIGFNTSSHHTPLHKLAQQLCQRDSGYTFFLPL